MSSANVKDLIYDNIFSTNTLVVTIKTRLWWDGIVVMVKPPPHLHTPHPCVAGQPQANHERIHIVRQENKFNPKLYTSVTLLFH